MKKIWVQFNKIKGEDYYKIEVWSNQEIEKTIFVEITQKDINELQDMLNTLNE